MKVFLTGATGAVGRPTVRRLLDAGHSVRAIARDDDKAAALRAAGADPASVDLFDPEAISRVVVGSEAIVHLATNIPPMSRAARTSSWATNNRLRTEGTRNLVEAARAHGIERVLKESITFLYPDRGDAWIDESTPLADIEAPIVQPTREGEELVNGFTDDGRTGVVLRFGLFYGHDDRGTDEALRLARWRRSRVAGDPRAYMSSLHLDDAAAAVVAALDVPAGVYNVVDDEPLTRRDYLDAFSAAFRTRPLKLTPAWILRAAAGDAAKLLTASQRVTNRRFRDASGWTPRYRSAREGWAAIAAARGHKEVVA